MRKNTFVSLCSLTEIKIAGVILLLILLAGLQGLFTTWYDSAFSSPMYADTWVRSGRLISALNDILREALILGIPLIIGVGCAAGRLRLRYVFLLLVLYALIVLQLIEPLRSIVMGLIVAPSALPFWQRCTTSFRLYFQNFPLVRMSVFLYIEAALTFVAACLIGWQTSRRRGQPIDLHSGKRTRVIIAVVCILLVLVTVLSLFGTITSPLLDWARSTVKPHEYSTETNVRYLLLGGSVASWGRPGAGGRGPVLLFSWVLFVLACLYGARRLTTRQTLVLAGIFTLSVILTQVVTPVSDELRSAYYSGLQLILMIYKHHQADFWLYNIPYPVTYLIQLLFCAGGLLGSAAIFRALSREPAK